MDRSWYNSDFKSGLFFIVVGAFTIWRGASYDIGTLNRMGPGYFPIILGVLLVALGGIAFSRSFYNGGDGLPEKFEFKSLILVVSAIVLFGVTLFSLGLAVAVPVLVVVSSLASDTFRLARVLVIAVAMLITCIGLFVHGLNMFIPILPSFPTWN